MIIVIVVIIIVVNVAIIVVIIVFSIVLIIFIIIISSGTPSFTVLIIANFFCILFGGRLVFSPQRQPCFSEPLTDNALVNTVVSSVLQYTFSLHGHNHLYCHRQRHHRHYHRDKHLTYPLANFEAKRRKNMSMNSSPYPKCSSLEPLFKVALCTILQRFEYHICINNFSVVNCLSHRTW